MKGVSLLWLLLLLSSFCSTDAVPLTPEEIQNIDNFVEGVMECYGIPGGYVAAVRNGTTVLTKGYGVKNIDTRDPVTENTAFNIASVSKQFTGTLLGIILRRHGNVDWNTPVSAILGPDFHMSDGYRTNFTNLRDLLSHKTSVPRHDNLWVFQFFENREELVSRMRFLDGITDIRTIFLYNNVMYALAGRVAEVLENLSWEDLIRRELFEPLGMTSSTFLDQDGEDRNRFATPYMTIDNVTFETHFDNHRSGRLVGPAISVSSTATDMAKWLKFLLSGTNEEGVEVLPIEELEALYAADYLHPQSDANNPFLRPHFPVTFGRVGYGKSWFTEYYKGYRSATHRGDYWGYHSEQVILPDMNIGTALSFNHPDQGLARSWVSAYVMDTLLGEENWLNVSYACSFASQSETNHNYMSDFGLPLNRVSLNQKPEEQFEPRRELPEYVGVYGRYGYGNINVTMGSPTDHLLMQVGRAGQFEMYPLGGDNFRLVNVGPDFFRDFDVAEFSSSGGSTGQIDRLVVPMIEILDPPVFQRDLDLSGAPPPDRNTC